MNFQTLNFDEKTRLITIILDSIDSLMEFDDFQETICQLCEDYSGPRIPDNSLRYALS